MEVTNNQFEQLFGLVTKVVGSIQNLEKEVKELRQGQDELRRVQNEMLQRQDNLQQGQDELRGEFDAFRKETRQEFVEVKAELKKIGRQKEILTLDVMEARGEVREAMKRMDALEDKLAA